DFGRRCGDRLERRKYSQTRRAASTAETRQRIIEGARSALTEGRLRSVSMDDIARAAGVARSTVNLVFGNRGNLLLAVAEDLLERGNFRDLQRAFMHPDALPALRGSLDVAMQLYAQEHKVGRALLSLAATDGDAAAAAMR